MLNFEIKLSFSAAATSRSSSVGSISEEAKPLSDKALTHTYLLQHLVFPEEIIDQKRPRRGIIAPHDCRRRNDYLYRNPENFLVKKLLKQRINLQKT